MNRDEVITALSSLMNGTDPATGTPLLADALHRPETRTVLSAATALLKDGARATRAGKFAAAGTAWSEEEDARLYREHESGMTIAQIALAHGRSSAAINLRLVKLGRIDAAAVKTRERGTRLAS